MSEKGDLLRYSKFENGRAEKLVFGDGCDF